MKKIIIVAALSFLLMAQAAFAAGVGVGAYYWMPEFNADFTAEGDIFPGTQLNLDDDLGLEDEDFVVVEAEVDLFSHHIFVSAVQVDYEGTATLSRDIEFADMVGQRPDLGRGVAHTHDVVRLLQAIYGILGHLHEVSFHGDFSPGTT